MAYSGWMEKLTGEQIAWLAALSEAGVETGVFRPRQWDSVVGLLTGKEKGNG
jgi:hypothetical protein